MKKIALLTFLLFTVTVVNAQQVKWVKDSLLTWKDFKGIPDPLVSAQALTHCLVRYSYHFAVHDNVYTLTFIIVSGFDTGTSWYVDGKQTPALLRHEQLHFDIHELYTRKLYALLSQYHYTSNYDDEARSIFRHFIIELGSIQLKYDEESEHSRNKSKQLAWEAKIKEQLNNTPSYPGI